MGHRLFVFHKEPIYDTNKDSLMMEGTNLYLPFSASMENNFMRYENSYSDFISLDLGHPKDVEIDGALVLGQHSSNFSRENDVSLHEERCHYLIEVHEGLKNKIRKQARLK